MREIGASLYRIGDNRKWFALGYLLLLLTVGAQTIAVSYTLPIMHSPFAYWVIFVTAVSSLVECIAIPVAVERFLLPRMYEEAIRIMLLHENQAKLSHSFTRVLKSYVEGLPVEMSEPEREAYRAALGRIDDKLCRLEQAASLYS